MAFAWNEKTFWLIQQGGWELPAIGIARRPGFSNNQTMIIDAHHHYVKEDGYPEQLVAEARRLGIDKVCLFGAGNSFSYGCARNEDVLAAARQHPDRIVPFACFDLGIDPPNLIDQFAAQGYRGIKFINPQKNYDDESFYDVYGRLESRKIPGLFHLGIVARDPSDKYYKIRNDRHRPVYLDTIARAFPDWKIIGAHFGNPWCDEAAMAARWNPNLYFDLSGSLLKYRSAKYLGELLWWTSTTRYRDPLRRHAWEKIVFGSDVPYREIEDVMTDYRRVMSELNLPRELQDKVFGGTMADILGFNA